MAELVLDGAQMATVASQFRQAGGDQLPPCPSVVYCGSDAVIDAFVQAFSTIRDQEQNVRVGWVNLAGRGQDAVAAMEASDAALAGSVG